MNDIIRRYYNTISRLRICMDHIKDIETIDYVISYGTVDNAKVLIDRLLTKYNYTATVFGNNYSAKPVVTSRNIENDLYSKKTTNDIVDDLLYLKDIIIIDAAVHAGLKPTVYDIIREMNKN